MPKLVFLFLFINCCFAYSQSFNSDSLPQFKYQNVISIQGQGGPIGAGIHYSRNFWSGMGYRNYEEISAGVGFGNQVLRNHMHQYETVPCIYYDIKIQHNARLGLKRLLFFSICLGYSPLVPVKKSSFVTHDDYINAGYVLIGVSGEINRSSIGFYLGAAVKESKQDLYYSTHTYAQFMPQTRIKIGFSFGNKYD